MRCWCLLPALAIASLAGCASAPPRVPRAPSERVQSVRALVRQAAQRHGVPEALVLGVIQIESGFRPDARSHVGARGLMQLMPRTAASLARRLGREDYDVEDPAFNIEAGTTYLAYLLDTFDGDLELALAGYNAGPYRVKRWQRDGRDMSAPVRRYVLAVLAARDRFAGQPVEAAPPAPAAEDTRMDRLALRELLRQKEQLYGERPDAPLPEPGARGEAINTEIEGATTAGPSPVGPTPAAAGTAPARSPAEAPAGGSGTSAAVP
jgi:hypothetical protein